MPSHERIPIVYRELKYALHAPTLHVHASVLVPLAYLYCTWPAVRPSVLMPRPRTVPLHRRLDRGDSRATLSLSSTTPLQSPCSDNGHACRRTGRAWKWKVWCGRRQNLCWRVSKVSKVTVGELVTRCLLPPRMHMPTSHITPPAPYVYSAGPAIVPAPHCAGRERRGLRLSGVFEHGRDRETIQEIGRC